RLRHPACGPSAAVRLRRQIRHANLHVQSRRGRRGRHPAFLLVACELPDPVGLCHADCHDACRHQRVLGPHRRGSAARPAGGDGTGRGSACNDGVSYHRGRTRNALSGGRRGGSALAAGLYPVGDGGGAGRAACAGGSTVNRLLPYPLLIVSIVVMWLALTRFSVGQLLLGAGVALVAAQGLAALRPSTPRLRRWDLIPKLIGIVLLDIVRSNIAVARLILSGKRAKRKSGFVAIPLELRDPMGLAVLAVIITSTPGTAWLDYSDRRGVLLLHIFDLVDESEWVDLIKTRYEYLLMEIFE